MRMREEDPMSIKNIQEAIPAMVRTLMYGDLVGANMLLNRFPRLLSLKDRQGRTLLMHAAYHGDPAILTYLVSFHVIASRDLDPSAEDKEGLTAYDWAVLGNNGFGANLLARVGREG
jgi:ankyrin repeat protein